MPLQPGNATAVMTINVKINKYINQSKPPPDFSSLKKINKNQNRSYRIKLHLNYSPFKTVLPLKILTNILNRKTSIIFHKKSANDDFAVFLESKAHDA